VLSACASLAALGVEISTLPVDEQGRVLPDTLASALRPETRIVSVMTANNETGTLQPVAELAAIAAEREIPLHTDAVQSASWFDLPTVIGEAAMVTLAGHKIAGPPGVGALVLRRPLDVQATIHGGGQQRGRRPGTEPTALLVGFGAACARAMREREAQVERIDALSRKLVAALESTIDGMRITVPDAARMPNTVHLAFADCPAGLLVARADLDGLAMSAGSACASGVSRGSHVLAAIGLEARYRDGAVRISLGYGTTEDEIERGAQIIAQAVQAVRHSAPIGATP
jgi:cysteine desulfurase